MSNTTFHNNHNHIIRVFHVRHELPGRVRLHCDSLRGDHRLAHGIRTYLNKQPGIRNVCASAASGNVLVEYLPDEVNLESLMDGLEHCHRSHNKWDETLEAREVEAVQSVRHVLEKWDHQLRGVTGGRMGLRHLAIGLLTWKAGFHILTAGPLTLEAAESVLETFLAWILFRHPRLEREVGKVEVYISPGI